MIRGSVPRRPGHRSVLARPRLLLLPALVPLVLSSAAEGWDGEGHRTVTVLALDGLPPQAPAWLREASARSRIAYESVEPDRWRSTATYPMAHENSPDHYIDIEDLAGFDLSLETLPPFRYEALEAMVLARRLSPEKAPPYDPSTDRDHSRKWPGYLPYAIAEHYAKLQSSFQTLRILERNSDSARSDEIEAARANVVYEMGILSHFVGDAAQPLHTTRHFNGWVGDNPQGYTSARSFHAYVDGALLAQHDVRYDTLRGQVSFDRRIDPKAPWNDIIEHIRRSFRQVEPLYKLEKEGSLKEAAGKQWLVARLNDGAAMLNAMYWAAYTSSEPSEDQVRDYVRRHYPGGTRPAGKDMKEN